MKSNFKALLGAVLLMVVLVGTFAYAATPKAAANYGPMPLCPLDNPNCGDDGPPMLHASAQYGPMPLCPLGDPDCGDDPPPALQVWFR